MKVQDRYKNKLFSILGDSISTLEGYSEPDYAVFYEGMKKFEADVFLPEDTWWGQVIERLGGSLLVNNSFSGSMVCRHSSCEIPSYGCSDERTESLSRGGRLPDVIMVFMGINDWGWDVRLTPESEEETADRSVFSVAYRLMLEKLQRNYPKAEIWCLTLPIGICKSGADEPSPYHGRRDMGEYCDVIRACAAECGCRVIDLYRSGASYDSIDDFHPNAKGMRSLADAVIKQL